MEKKTIGKFISVLRRANGMTQKELAEKLFVSDKTVSRWECDECAPDLALIPVIADLFDVTSDELLRGERKNSENDENDGGRYALKSEKQFNVLLQNRLRKYGDLTMISLGLAIVGWLLGILCNFAFNNGVLGFVLGTILFMASEISQICFLRNMRLNLDEEGHQVRVQEVNARMVKRLIWVSVLNLALFANTLPMAFAGGTAGLAFITWLGMGSIFTAVTLVLVYIVYTLCIHPYLLKREFLLKNDGDEERRKNVKRMGKVGSMVAIIALLICGGVLVINVIGWQAFASYDTYYDAASFKERMESDYEKWINNQFDGEIVLDPTVGEYKNYDYIYDENGEKVEYYCYKRRYYAIDYLENDRSVPVRVLTMSEFYSAFYTFEELQTYIWWLIPVDITGGVIAYVILSVKAKKKK